MRSTDSRDVSWLGAHRSNVVVALYPISATKICYAGQRAGRYIAVTYHYIRGEPSDCGSYATEAVHPIIVSDDKPWDIIVKILQRVSV